MGEAQAMSEVGSQMSCAAHPIAGMLGLLKPGDRLFLPASKSIVCQYALNDSGARELRLYYGAKEISFDEPELFSFGETLARQTEFVAGDTVDWGEDLTWPRMSGLLEQLLDEGVLQRVRTDIRPEAPVLERAQPSPLPPAICRFPRTWAEAEAITREQTGRAVETGYIELIVPIFRVAHCAMDADGRHIGEANVFPRALRTETSTEWMTCIYPGTRYLADKPMNVTALKAMRAHWPQMMAALLHLRARFLKRFPQINYGWTIGQLERLATAVLCIPSYQLMRCDNPTPNGMLHPALSSLFRVTDGLRMVMHQMLFVPFGEPTRSPDEVVTVAEIHDYAERNYSFYSDTGVCAGPRHMVREFLAVLVDGQRQEKYGDVPLDLDVAAALTDADHAIDYALLGLQAYAATFSLWPAMTRTYEALAKIAADAVTDGCVSLTTFNARMTAHRIELQSSPFLAKETWRADRDHVYADMFGQCGLGLSPTLPPENFANLIAPRASSESQFARRALMQHLERVVGVQRHGNLHFDALIETIMDFVLRTQAILRAATEVQHRINALLARSEPVRVFTARDMDVHNLLQGSEARRLPYLIDELEAAFGLQIEIDADHLQIVPHQPQAGA